MPRAIQLYREMSFRTEEIDDPISDRNLPAEFQTAQLPVA
jgi:hypothetical protein